MGEDDPLYADELAEVDALNHLLARLDPTGEIQKQADVTDGTTR
jgi:hypothetical protein